MKERIGWIDITKGIAIILVVVGHTLIGLKLNYYIFALQLTSNNPLLHKYEKDYCSVSFLFNSLY